jgi:hypothetical protein
MHEPTSDQRSLRRKQSSSIDVMATRSVPVQAGRPPPPMSFLVQTV